MGTNFFGECTIKDMRTKEAGENTFHAGKKYTEIKMDCNGEEVILALGKEGGQTFLDVKRGGSVVSKKGENAVRYLLGL